MYNGNRSFKHDPSPFLKRRKVRFIQERFQLKYTSFLVGAVMLSLLVFGTPIYYFTRQNYNIFTKLAYSSAPELVQHLEREWAWFHMFLLIALIGVVVICIISGIHMTARMITPLALMEEHLKKLTRGSWNIPPIRVRSGDEFQELMQVYNYFYNSLRANAESELMMIEKIRLDPKNMESLYHWDRLAMIKSNQLGQPKPQASIADEPVQSPDLRRVS